MPDSRCLAHAMQAGRLAALLCAAGLSACGGPHSPSAAAPADAAAGDGAATGAAGKTGCLPGERGFLTVRLKGALEGELQWRGAALLCEGGARPDGRGLRASFAGPGIGAAAGHTLRFVFGLAARPGAAMGHNVPARLTVIAEGSAKAWATQDDGQCMVEALVQERLPDASGSAPAAGTSLWRIAARGYCIDPAMRLDGGERLYIDRFDFAGLARFEDNELHEHAD